MRREKPEVQMTLEGTPQDEEFAQIMRDWRRSGWVRLYVPKSGLPQK